MMSEQEQDGPGQAACMGRFAVSQATAPDESYVEACKRPPRVLPDKDGGFQRLQHARAWTWKPLQALDYRLHGSHDALRLYETHPPDLEYLNCELGITSQKQKEGTIEISIIDSSLCRSICLCFEVSLELTNCLGQSSLCLLDAGNTMAMVEHREKRDSRKFLASRARSLVIRGNSR